MKPERIEELADEAFEKMWAEETVSTQYIIAALLTCAREAAEERGELLRECEGALQDERDAREDESGDEDEAIAGFAKQRMVAIDAILTKLREAKP